MRNETNWGDVVFGLLMLWTLLGMLGMVLGLHIGWWDLLGAVPVDPRHST